MLVNMLELFRKVLTTRGSRQPSGAVAGRSDFLQKGGLDTNPSFSYLSASIRNNSDLFLERESLIILSQH